VVQVTLPLEQSILGWALSNVPQLFIHLLEGIFTKPRLLLVLLGEVLLLLISPSPLLLGQLLALKDPWAIVSSIFLVLPGRAYSGPSFTGTPLS